MTIIVSQHQIFEGGLLVVENDIRTFSSRYGPTQRSQFEKVHYDGQENLPINMFYVRTFEKDEWDTGKGFAYPVIRFYMSDGSSELWCYTPTKDGEVFRDVEYRMIIDRFCTKLPYVDPRVPA